MLSSLFRTAALASLVVLSACGHDNTPPSPPPQLQRSADTAVSQGLAGVVVSHLTPGDTQQGVAGLRQSGGTAALQSSDAFMIGSTTKAFTAAMAGRLVERGLIAWTTTLADALPDLAAGMQPAYRLVTLEQLLGHRGGLLAFNNPADFERFQTYLATAPQPLPTTLAGRERFFAAWLLAQDPPPQVTPGRDFAYSNAGYALAAMMLEARSGRPYLELFQQELAQPLGLSVSFTAADQSLPVAGHVGAKGKLAVTTAEPADNARWLELMRPAGMGLTLAPSQYAIWVRTHLKALQGARTPLADTYLQKLKTLAAGDYALGWIATDIDGRRVLAHDGEYNGFTSLVVMDLAGRSASFAFTNTEADDGQWTLTVLNQAVLDVERALPPK